MLIDIARRGATPLRDVKYISSSISNSSVALNTVTAPTGITDGDLLVAFGLNVRPALSITYPEGFSQRLLDNGTFNSVFVATKVASGESGNYDFTWSGSPVNTVAILVYRNAIDSDRLIGAVTRADSRDTTAVSISPTNEGALIGFFALEGNEPVSVAPIGMTQRALQTADDPSVAIYDLVPNSTGATGDKTLSWEDNEDNVGFLMQIYRG
jgi:hypothetical protein